ncbi:hypothetical protein DM01DRAFT_1333207 [Hesseltinella vesiculosa]|uniref:Chromo domain-containing protein n=1 Tax=Hesseltinella vesiculosa TaxID=101127 RepID=A0A1X2GT02_9FUNG|nr:hypothetical protein DM01DRAFT_1333207 [Hesseltinella vesiculosa]
MTSTSPWNEGIIDIWFTELDQQTLTPTPKQGEFDALWKDIIGCDPPNNVDLSGLQEKATMAQHSPLVRDNDSDQLNTSPTDSLPHRSDSSSPYSTLPIPSSADPPSPPFQLARMDASHVLTPATINPSMCRRAPGLSLDGFKRVLKRRHCRPPPNPLLSKQRSFFTVPTTRLAVRQNYNESVKTPEPSTPPPVLSEEHYEVEFIRGHRMKKRCCTHYLVKWKGYSEDDNTWEESEHMLEDTPLSVLNYWDDMPKNVKRPQGLPLREKITPPPSDESGTEDTCSTLSRSATTSPVPEDLLMMSSSDDDDDNSSANSSLHGRGIHWNVGSSYGPQDKIIRLARRCRINESDLDMTFRLDGYRLAYTSFDPSIDVAAADDYDIQTVLRLKRNPNVLLAYLTWNNGLKTAHLIEELHQHNPAKLFSFYESNISYL